MPVIPWSDDMLVNVEKIDSQHRKLVALLNRFADAIQNGETRDVVSETIVALADYTFYHFMTEEKYFDRFQYSDSESHRNEHHYFIQQVTDFQKQLDRKQEILSDDILLFLTGWVRNHILGIDQNLGLFLNEQGDLLILLL